MEWLPVRQQQQLFQDDSLRTGGHDRLGIAYGDGLQIRLDVNTRFTILSIATPPGSRDLGRLLLGRLWARVSDLPDATASAELHAGGVTVRCGSAEFVLSIDAGERVSLLVLSGEAAMTALGRTTTVTARQRCDAAAGQPPGEPTRGDIGEANWADLLSPSSSLRNRRDTSNALLGVGAVALLVALLGASSSNFYRAPEMYTPQYAGQNLRLPSEALAKLMSPIAQGGKGETGTLHAGSNSAGLTLGLRDIDKSRDGSAGGASLFAHGSWEPWNRFPGLVIDVGKAFSLAANPNQRTVLTHLAVRVPLGPQTAASLELRHWDPAMLGQQRWALALFGHGPARVGVARSLHNGCRAWLLETRLNR
jgi:hypothetical protein